jgi:ABC transporter transmembrane region
MSSQSQGGEGSPNSSRSMQQQKDGESNGAKALNVVRIGGGGGGGIGVATDVLEESSAETSATEREAAKSKEGEEGEIADLVVKPEPKPWKGPQNGRDLGMWESSLEDRANCLSRWLLNYMNPMLKLGSHKVLEQDDMGVPSKEDLADRAYQVAKDAFDEQSAKARAANVKIKAAYEAKLAKCATDEQRAKVKAPVYKEPSIAMALVKGFGMWQLIVGIIYYIISALLTFVPVLILNDLVKLFQSGLPIDEYNGFAHPWVEVAGLGVIPFIISLLQTRHQVIMAHCAVFVRTSVSTLLYRKALRVSAAARAMTSTGQVVNMMSNDTAQLQRFLQFVGMVMVAPIQIILALALIFLQVRDENVLNLRKNHRAAQFTSQTNFPCS